MTPPTASSWKSWGDLACFTRPELKTERVSYPPIPPPPRRRAPSSMPSTTSRSSSGRCAASVLPPRHGSAAWGRLWSTALHRPSTQ